MTESDELGALDPRKELVITRVFDAPRDLVWKVWTEPRHVVQWWRPDVFTIPVCELDVRPGGAIRVDMQGPDGTIYPMTGVYHEVVEPVRLVFVTGAVPDTAGDPQLEMHNTVTLEEAGDKTRLTQRLRVLKATVDATFALEGLEMGWNQSLDKLAALAESLA